MNNGVSLHTLSLYIAVLICNQLFKELKTFTTYKLNISTVEKEAS